MYKPPATSTKSVSNSKDDIKPRIILPVKSNKSTNDKTKEALLNENKTKSKNSLLEKSPKLAGYFKA